MLQSVDKNKALTAEQIPFRKFPGKPKAQQGSDSSIENYSDIPHALHFRFPLSNSPGLRFSAAEKHDSGHWALYV